MHFYFDISIAEVFFIIIYAKLLFIINYAELLLFVITELIILYAELLFIFILVLQEPLSNILKRDYSMRKCKK